IKSLLPYLLAYKWRVALALSFLIAAKVANLGVPMVMKRLIDSMNVSPSDPRALLVVPVGIIIGYGLLRLSTSLFSELREILFAKVT
ncbi:hypothetical protein KC219_24380, partial [Mycobacterium tuberculosis]|nr:hypothetical protein [Mycobacterium tuberculosis]